MRDRTNKQKHPMIMLVDGHCHLCNGITKFVIKRDKAAKFQFASLQSQIGQRLLAEGALPLHDLDTFVFIHGDRYYTKSGAALRVLRQLSGLWPLLYPLLIVPVPVRNVVYDFIASNRYRWFGRSDSCLLPNAALRERFLDD